MDGSEKEKGRRYWWHGKKTNKLRLPKKPTDIKTVELNEVPQILKGGLATKG